MTVVTIEGAAWHLDGARTYPGAAAEGLLMNVRMANAVFEDRNRPEFDAEANTDRFIARIGDYTAEGVRAFTLCLQGGFPGYEGAVNSAFESDGSLRHSYMARVARAIEACDAAGMVVILGCFYQRQSGILSGVDAIRAGVQSVARWIGAQGYGHVLLEIANEYPHRGFVHPYLQSAEGEAELIRRAKQVEPGLLVSTSGVGNACLHEEVAEAAGYLLIHYNETPVNAIAPAVEALKRFGKPIVCNEDAKSGHQGAAAAEASVAAGASWGYMAEGANQHYPFRYEGRADDPPVYEALRRLTAPQLPPH